MSPHNALEAIRQSGIVIASDTAEYKRIAKFHPIDATSNPSLVLAALSKREYAHFLDNAVTYACKSLPNGTTEEQTSLALDYLLVQIGIQILNIIPGRVSISVDPRLAHNYDAILAKAHSLISLFEKFDISRHRILIKIPATYPGILAARTLESTAEINGGPIHTNITLIFGLVQALACAQAGVSVLSPFIGRVRDWWVAQEAHLNVNGTNTSAVPTSQLPLAQHPGILLVRQIRQAYKAYNHQSQVMAAGFRTVDEIIELSKAGPQFGPDLVTLPPELLDGLKARKPAASSSGPDIVVTELGSVSGVVDSASNPEPLYVSNNPAYNGEAKFKEDLMKERIALDKVPEGLNKFAVDATTLESLVKLRLSEKKWRAGLWMMWSSVMGVVIFGLTMWHYLGPFDPAEEYTPFART
ncbi:transaldolase [Pluteus cervinus]|uniref:Transaldolase n=1 Tax=Pluteus cervinus TaxID=181527 RepID=A0ACD3B579_9AGAR|nr:transaldolase [Pluteus cervinus]